MSDLKEFKSKEYNYVFNRKTGVFIRWGLQLFMEIYAKLRKPEQNYLTN